MKTILTSLCICGEDLYEDDTTCVNCGAAVDTTQLRREEIAEIVRETHAPRFESEESGAEFSPDGAYRYALWRRWGWEGYGQQVMFIGLNPSTAAATADDPTIRRCIGFAKAWGYHGLLMLNLYAYRATDPRLLPVADDPIGPGNDEALCYRRTQVGRIVAAWGAQADPQRAEAVCRLIGKPLYCLGTTQAGQPKHPLSLRKDTPLERFSQE